MKKLLAVLALLCSVTANAQTTFPISLVKIDEVKPGFISHEGNQITWHSTIPGLSFCVAYSAMHGVSIGPHMQGHLYTEDFTHCLTTDGDGNATDVLTVNRYAKAGKGLVIANLVLAGDQINTITIPVQKLHFDWNN